MEQSKDIRTIYKRTIKNYVNRRKKNRESIGTRRQIYYEINEILENKLAKSEFIKISTFYKYLDELDFYRHSDYNFGFNEQTVNLNSLITMWNYNQHLCFSVRNEHYAPIICDKLNNYFQEWKRYLHCIYAQNFIICFFDANIVSEDELKIKIPDFLKDFSLEDYAVNRNIFKSDYDLSDNDE